MAIVKHNSSKNVNYSDVLDYYTYQHTEDPKTGHYEPILDEFGFNQSRENYAVTYFTAQGTEEAPELWAAACVRTNRAFGKNGGYEDVKNHEYIISHPAEDRPKMAMEDLLEEGKAFVRDNLHGYDALIAVHRDTDNDHVHIAINSVRARQREEEPWMVKNSDGSTKLCEMCAGGKHQDNAAFRRHCNDWLLEYSRSHGLEVKDNNAIADRHKEERYDAASAKKLTVHQRQLREAFLKARETSGSLQELKDTLMADYGITLIQRGNTFSLLHPENQKPDRLRALGLDNSMVQFDRETDALEEPPVKRNPDGSPQFEKKPYAQWMMERRTKNSEKVENTIAQADVVVNEKLASLVKGKKRSNPLAVKKLDALIQKTVYAEKDLQAEADKLDALLVRWQQCQDPALPRKERQRHESYLKWCGCDMNSMDLITEYRREIDQEIGRLTAAREVLRQKKFSAGNEFYPESKKYFQWLRERRLDNTGKAEDAIARAEDVIAARLRAKGEYYSEADFRELDSLIRKTSYVERDLQTEKDKLDALLDRWQKYLDPSLPEKEHKSHENYLRWCGCDPESPVVLEYLQVQRELADLQLRHIVSIRDSLTDTAGQWRGVNEDPESKRNLTLDKEAQLKQQLKDVRANRVELGEIAANCHRAVKRRVYKDAALAKADYFQKKWMETLEKEKQIQRHLKAIRQEKRSLPR